MSLSCLCVLPTLAAQFSTSIGFPSAPQSQGCTKSRTDNQTTVCYASLNDSQGTALVNLYAKGTDTYVILGTIQVTQPESSTTTVTASLSATLTEFRELTSGGVLLTNNCTQDCEPLTVTVNGVQVGVLSDAQSLSIPYGGAETADSAQRRRNRRGRGYRLYWHVQYHGQCVPVRMVPKQEFSAT